MNDPYIGEDGLLHYPAPVARKPAPAPRAADKPGKEKRWAKKPVTLASLFQRCRFAPVVWLALLELSAERGGSRIVTPTRTELAKRTGIDRFPTISAALTALEKAGWIERHHVPSFRGSRRTATLLRIELRRRERKLFATETITVENKKCSKG